MSNDLRKVLHRTLSAPGVGLADGELLARFVSSRDEAAFEVLVRRHGPMVLSVCRRVLGHEQDAEDCFQAAFLVLTRKAGSVVKRNSVGGWLYRVAYHIALEARAAAERRRARERQVDQMPHPEVAPEEPQDWKPLLERELAQLPDKYREAIVLCELEGLSRKEAASQLGLPEGTLSSRLAFARKKLATQLSRAGVTLPAGARVIALSEVAVSAPLPVPLVSSTVRAAMLLAAGEAAALATPAAVLMKGAMQTMFLQKLKVVTATAVVLAALGAGGLAWRAGGTAVADDKLGQGKPRNELESLRRENELLKLNLEVVLEKVRAQEATIRDLSKRRTPPMGLPGGQPPGGMQGMGPPGGFPRGGMPGVRPPMGLGGGLPGGFGGPAMPGEGTPNVGRGQPSAPDALKQVEDALKVLRHGNAEEQRKAVEALEKALRSLKGRMKPRTRRVDPLLRPRE